MTKEEAIKVIKANYPSGGYEDLCQALDMAIKALEERKKRRWIKFDGHFGMWYCECGGQRLGKHRYCECCGAEMVNWRE